MAALVAAHRAEVDALSAGAAAAVAAADAEKAGLAAALDAANAQVAALLAAAEAAAVASVEAAAVVVAKAAPVASAEAEAATEAAAATVDVAPLEADMGMLSPVVESPESKGDCNSDESCTASSDKSSDGGSTAGKSSSDEEDDDEVQHEAEDQDEEEGGDEFAHACTAAPRTALESLDPNSPQAVKSSKYSPGVVGRTTMRIREKANQRKAKSAGSASDLGGAAKKKMCVSPRRTRSSIMRSAKENVS